MPRVRGGGDNVLSFALLARRRWTRSNGGAAGVLLAAPPTTRTTTTSGVSSTVPGVVTTTWSFAAAVDNRSLLSTAAAPRPPSSSTTVPRLSERTLMTRRTALSDRWEPCSWRSGRYCSFSTSTSATTAGYLNAGANSGVGASFTRHEVDKFSAMDDAWWDPIQNPLIGMNAIRVDYIRQQILQASSTTMSHDDDDNDSNHVNEKGDQLATRIRRVLDVGCGGGLLCESLQRLELWEPSTRSLSPATRHLVVGIDPSSRLIEVARKHAALDPRTLNIDYRCTTVEEYAAQVLGSKDDESHDHNHENGGLFDVICLLEVVEHVDDPAHLDSMMAAISSLLRPNGLLFVSTLNQTWKSHLLTIVGAEYIMRYLPIGTHQWNLYKSPRDMKRLVETHGMQQVNVCGMVPTSVPLPMLPSALSPNWQWKLDPNDIDVNWIGTYQKQ